MKFKRLVVEDGTSSRYIDLHPRLTVVAGLDQADRRVLLGELRNSLGAHADGSHLELETNNGSHLAVFRAPGGDHRVIDVVNTNDVTPYFLDASGNVNPAFGMKMHDEKLVIDSASLANRVDEDRNLDALTGADQEQLWAALDRIRETEALTAEAERQHSELKPDTEAEVSAEVYDNYFASSEPVPTTYKIATFVALGLAAGAAYCFTAGLTYIGAGLGVVGLFALGYFGYPLVRQLLAQRAANNALEEAGVDNFFDFQLQQVDGMLAQDEYRKKLRHASTEHEEAVEAWNEIAGDIEPSFAHAHRTAIQTGAALRAADPEDDPTSGFLHPTTPLVLRAIGTVDTETETVPRILDAPFSGLDEENRRTLLDTLFVASEHRQMILLANEADVSSWALQHLGGDASIVPGFSSVEDTPAQPEPSVVEAVAAEADGWGDPVEAIEESVAEEAVVDHDSTDEPAVDEADETETGNPYVDSGFNMPEAVEPHETTIA